MSETSVSEKAIAPQEAGISYSTREWITPTFSHALRVWWAYYWPTWLIAAAIQFGAGVGLFAMARAGDLTPDEQTWILRVMPFVATAAVGLFVFQYLLTARFGNFRIAIFPATYGENQLSLPPTFAHGTRIWMAFTWRAILFSVIAGFFVTFPLNAIVAIVTFGTMPPLVAAVLVGALLNGGVGLFVMYSSILDEEFGTFSVRLVPRQPGPPVQPTQPSQRGILSASS